MLFTQLGSRIAKLRKDQGVIQVQLAERLCVSQQTITAYEVGRRRIQVSALQVIAQSLGVEELAGAPPLPRKRGPAPKLQQQLEQLSRLPKAQQQLASQVIDTVLQQHGG